MPNLGALGQVTEGLRRLAGGIARELQEQRRQAVRSLNVVTRHWSLDSCWSLASRRPESASVASAEAYARSTDLAEFPRQHLQL